jgi:dihydropteroate synthase
VEQNFALLARQAELLARRIPACWQAGRASRRWATVTGWPVDDRMVPSVAAAVLAVERGARIVRVHDVRETVAALEGLAATMIAEQDDNP